MDQKKDNNGATRRASLRLLKPLELQPLQSSAVSTSLRSRMEMGAIAPTLFSLLRFHTHEAAKTGNLPELQRLFAFPQENPFRTDYSGKTPLHHAANFGNPKISHAMAEVILSCKFLEIPANTGEKARLVNIQNAQGETALHLAAKNAHRKVVELLLNNEADVNVESEEKKEAIELVYTFVPHAMITMFDDSVTSNYTELHEEKFEVNVNFGPIVGVPGPQESTLFMETELLKYALNGSPSKYKDLLLHPLVQLFLHYKWNKIQSLFAASILFHVTWLLVYSLFVMDLYLKKCPYIPTPNSTETTDTSDSSPEMISCPVDDLNIPLAWLLVSASLLTALKEVYELGTAPTCVYYFAHLENVGQILVILAATLAASPVLSLSLSLLVSDEDSLVSSLSLSPWNYQVAAYGVFLSWTLILLQIGKTPRLGIYVQVLVKALKSFGLFIVTFISLLTAFALSFSILMPQNEMFSSIPSALSKVLVMMTGELQYDEVFYNETSDALPFPISAQLFFAAFVIMVTIILFNLLIGFTVSDIQGLQETATVSRLSNQLEQIHVMESFLFSSGFASFLTLLKVNPEKCLRRFMVTGYHSEDVSSDSTLPQRDTSIASFSTVVTKTTKQIPKNLRTKVKDLAIRNLEGSGGSPDEAPPLPTVPTDANCCAFSQDELKALISKAVCDTLTTHFHIPPTPTHPQYSPHLHV